MSATTIGALIAEADEAFAQGHLEQSLRSYAALLDADPTNRYCWYRSAVCLGRLGAPAAAVAALEGVVEALAEAGELVLALCAARDLAELDPTRAEQRYAALARRYAAGSARLAPQRRPGPPPPPKRGESPARLEAEDLAVLRLAAEEACERAAAAARSQERPTTAPLPFHPIFSELDPANFSKLIPLIRLVVASPGEVVIEQGSEGTCFYIVARGNVVVSRDEVHLARLGGGAFFGEMALLTNSPRVARVVADGAAILLAFDRDAVEELAGSSTNVARVLAEHTRRRMLRNLMATSPLFAPLSPERREGLMELFSSRVYQPGEAVVVEGEDAAGLHLVLSGAVRVSKQEADGEALALAELGPGQIFGEISLIQQSPATASVTALEKAVVLCLPRQAFNERVAEFPEVLAHVYQVAQQRRQTNVQLASDQSVPVDEDLLI